MLVAASLIARVAALLLVPAAVSQAQVIAFAGSRTAQRIPVPPPNPARCGPPPSTLITGVNGIGTSSLGAFTTVESNCLNPITGSLFNGLFSFLFAGGNTFFGTATGRVVLPPVEGKTTNTFEYLITGGTGQFAGATGRLHVEGAVTFNPDGTTDNTFRYIGTISTVPEPSTALLVGAGLAGLGMCARQRRAGRLD
ncbi:MAG: PEP-CTERM sorting domain-containing protein [Gemmatimonadaceae bacterium]|nr:PEP-CTERM sorting domain-containing protein [Gemmatimonadaceae bacterium]